MIGGLGPLDLTGLIAVVVAITVLAYREFLRPFSAPSAQGRRRLAGLLLWPLLLLASVALAARFLLMLRTG